MMQRQHEYSSRNINRSARAERNRKSAPDHPSAGPVKSWVADAIVAFSHPPSIVFRPEESNCCHDSFTQCSAPRTP